MKDEADKLSERLSAYLDGQLSAEQAAALEQELAATPPWRASWRPCGTRASCCGGSPGQAAPPEMLESILQRVERERLLSQPAHRGRPAAALDAIRRRGRRHRPGRGRGRGHLPDAPAGLGGKNHLEVAVSSNPDKVLSLPREASGRRSGVRESVPAGGGSVDLDGDTDLDVGSLAMRPEAARTGRGRSTRPGG